MKWLDKALERGVGCSFTFGRWLTNTGQPYLVYCYCGELFTFPLTSRQASRLKVRETELISAVGAAQQDHGPHPEPPVNLEEVEVDSAEAFDRVRPIEGTLKYQTEHVWDLPLAIQVVCESGGRTTTALYHHLSGVFRGEGTVRFSVPAVEHLRDHEGQPFTGILPLFFQLCIAGEPEKDPRASPFGWVSGHGHGLPAAAQPAIPAPPTQRKLGERFTPPSPMPVLMTPTTMVPAKTALADPFDSGLQVPHAGTWPPVQPVAPDRTRFRAISDIRAVLIEVDV
jgi:hypothetical protein